MDVNYGHRLLVIFMTSVLLGVNLYVEFAVFRLMWATTCSCQCLPVLNEICQLCLRFLYLYVNHKMTIFRSVAINGIVYDWGYSLM